MNRHPRSSSPSSDQQFSAFFHQHVDSVHRAASRRVGFENADDVVTETFTLAWQKDVASFEGQRARAWLLTTAAFMCQNMLRSRHRDSRKEAALAQVIAIDAPLDESGRLDHLQQAWHLISTIDQELLTLTFWDDLPYPEIAQKLGIKQGALRTRISRAKTRLGEQLVSVQATARAHTGAQKW